MFLSLLLLAAQAQDVVIRTSEPRPASPWVEVVSGRCGDDRLELRRPRWPLPSSAVVRLNRRTPEGDLGLLERELSEPAAAYRFSVLCTPNNETLELRWVRGLADQQGQVAFRSGSAEFRDGTLIAVRSEEADSEAFWYR
ncbi:hypothetical protein IP78_13385 [Brevundimonas sp. AAP58]|uniref:hypothetical protein n=1 Tax=Brevundimonas sp. AAP58 TaxID=1523422 RepID=UPI0006B96828|nr:hypothetical protein [Brevundimonas sp. AAP58]KPF75799.1 hypothetical protein IP78_13385 [Brevundimonas sp. AAP58]